MGVGTKYLVLISLFLLLLVPVSASEFDYNKYRGTTELQNDFSSYMNNLQAKIQRCWNPPDFVEDGDATVMFKVTRWGKIVSVDFVKSSNNPVFDESALEALRKAEPFDKFPANTSKESLTIKYNFHTSIVKTDTMRECMENADRYYNVNNQTALNYINKAIDEVSGDAESYFLYEKRCKIRQALGDYKGAKEDSAEAKRLKERYDLKRIKTCKLIAEMEQSPFSYFYLAHAYEIAGDYEHALEAIDKAIDLTELNNQYKRYRQELEQKKGVSL